MTTMSVAMPGLHVSLVVRNTDDKELFFKSALIGTVLV